MDGTRSVDGEGSVGPRYCRGRIGVDGTRSIDREGSIGPRYCRGRAEVGETLSIVEDSVAPSLNTVGVG